MPGPLFSELNLGFEGVKNFLSILRTGGSKAGVSELQEKGVGK